jgi:hypothetical protein
MNFFRRKAEQSDALLGPARGWKCDKSVYGSTSCDDAEARSSYGCDSDGYQTASLSGASSGTYEINESDSSPQHKPRPNWIRTTIFLTNDGTLNDLESQYLDHGSTSNNNEVSTDSYESEEESSLIAVTEQALDLEKTEEVPTSDPTVSTVSF